MGGAALRTGFAAPIAGAASGALAGTSFVAKDNFDVIGHRTGCGQPSWLEDAAPATRSAPAVDMVLAAGVSCVGKAIMDELAFSLSGTNVHYGTPRNPAAPDREPGGSSSGCASAVACGLVDFALASDTGGSSRVPASYCGILGFRPTHGRVSTDGLAPLAPSFDTVGWLARAGDVLECVGRVLLDTREAGGAVERILVARDAVQLLDEECVAPFDDALRRAADGLGAELVPIDLSGADSDPEAWFLAFRALQGHEAWASWGEWIRRRQPALGPGIAARFEYAATMTWDHAAGAARVGDRACARLAELLPAGTVLALPTASGLALPLTMGRDGKDERRLRTLRLTTIAALTGAPALSLPLCTANDLPLGLTLMAAPGEDERLLAAARLLVP